MNKGTKTILLTCIILLLFTSCAYAEGFEVRDYVPSIQLLVLFTILALLPAIVIMMTSFTRIIIVLSFIRNAVGTQQTPPNQVLIGLALFLTFFIMAPVATEINDNAIQPYLNEEIGQDVAIERGIEPLRNFMLKQTEGKDLSLFMDIAQIDEVENTDDIPTKALVPAFVIGELRKAFKMGFILFIPFLVIDMIVASTLMSMGMMMLPPIMISLPFKILLFILVDGWHLVIRSLVLSFN
ncbi:flagellar type III secretion system pore protein FliP [Sporosalibacterium faouarense]|uniref:flagellar type III secretion system pore protein FliP n=1 Tax=Sporosalibacterium faouarense TaxID=516123 RepID=UPI00141C0B10|nr:flagellar type III secretion system pore protein FliP [Sporosalibacterium faouarense]MTI48004.1 flagellar type III secretion system pore protein FliP [Bacillota bacterium]